VPSAKRLPQLAVLALCGALGAGSLAGCETTQEKATAQRAESERILEARAKRQAERKHHKHDKHHADQKGKR
jgi:regulator of protease activity HflC (stomatin/prohibitin superfamily)